MQLVAHLLVGGGGRQIPPGSQMRLEPRRDVDPVAHEVAVGLLDHVAQMNADADLDARVRRKTGVALGKPALHVDGRSHGLDHAAELDHRPVAGALDEPPVVDGDGGVDEVAAQALRRASVRSSSAPVSRL